MELIQPLYRVTLDGSGLFHLLRNPTGGSRCQTGFYAADDDRFTWVYLYR